MPVEDVPGYKAVVKVVATAGAVKSPATIRVGKQAIEITCLGDTSRSFLMGLENEVRFSLTFLRDGSTEYIALQTAYTAGTVVVIDIWDGKAAPASVYKASFFVVEKSTTFDMSDAEVTEFTFLKHGATTTDAL